MAGGLGGGRLGAEGDEGTLYPHEAIGLARISLASFMSTNGAQKAIVPQLSQGCQACWPGRGRDGGISCWVPVGTLECGTLALYLFQQGRRWRGTVRPRAQVQSP